MINRFRLQNFKSWKDTQDIDLKPITGFFGANSSGKTSLIQALLLMKQTIDSPDRSVPFDFGNEETLVDLGDFTSVVHKHEIGEPIKFSLTWSNKEMFPIPERYDGGNCAMGDEIDFEAEVQIRRSGSADQITMESMQYRIGDLKIGMRHLNSSPQIGYEVFARSHLSDEAGVTRRGLLDRRRSWKFHEFPMSAARIVKEMELLEDLEYSLESFFDAIHYLGPFRAFPYRTYRRSGTQPGDLGADGRAMVDAILSARERRVGVRPDLGSRGSISIDKYIAQWLKRLGLVHEFRVRPLTRNRPIYEVLVRKSPNSAEVLLTDVGFGVSQILPILVLCFYAPRGSTLILEQPEIHLHPAVQSGLADVLIDAHKLRNVQILVESHSEHLLRRLQRRIAEEEIPEEDVGMFFCSIRDDGSSSLQELDMDQFGNISNWPEDFFGDQFGEIAAMSEAALSRQGES